MDADAPLDAALRNRRRVALGHLRLHFAGATQRIDGAAEFDQQTVAGGLDDPPVMGGDLRIHQLAPDRLEPWARRNKRSSRGLCKESDAEITRLPGLNRSQTRQAALRATKWMRRNDTFTVGLHADPAA